MKSTLRTLDLANKTVFLRADLNVPLEKGIMSDDFRLRALLPTLSTLSEKKARIILASHIGRPHEKDPSLSTKQLIPWFIDKGYLIEWAETIEDAQNKIQLARPGSLILLENLRFFPEEQGTDLAFTQALKELAEYYVDDAWGSLASHDSSIFLLPQQYEPHHKTIGLLVEKELEKLDQLLAPKRPYVMLLGGAKIHEKLPTIQQALKIADAVIVLPALVFTFLKAQGKEVGQSLVDDSLLTRAQEILAQAENSHAKFILPRDFLVGKTLKEGPYFYSPVIEADQFGIASGTESLLEYDRIIQQAGTIFLNGTMGFSELSDTTEPIKKLLQSIAQASAYSVVGGGDTVAAVHLLHAEDSFSFCSTGGGATLQYILYKTLPGLTYLS